jgi:RimJ/RimL family protein N-acetyltransferase
MINGDRIALGPLLPADFPLLFRWADDREATLMNEPYRPPSWKGQQEYWLSAAPDASKILFAIRRRQDQALIGYIQLLQIDAIHRSATIGIRIGEAAQRGQGFGREALHLAVEFCWNGLNLSRLGLCVFAHNESALRLYASAGFEREGLLKRALFIDGRWVDVVIMSLLHPSR